MGQDKQIWCYKKKTQGFLWRSNLSYLKTLWVKKPNFCKTWSSRQKLKAKTKVLQVRYFCGYVQIMFQKNQEYSSFVVKSTRVWAPEGRITRSPTHYILTKQPNVFCMYIQSYFTWHNLSSMSGKDIQKVCSSDFKNLYPTSNKSILLCFSCR